MGANERQPQFIEPFSLSAYQHQAKKSLFASYRYNNLEFEEWHAHTQAQLTYSSQGALQIHTSDGIWTLPQGRALWIPAGHPHRTHAQGQVKTCNFYCSDRGKVTDFIALDISTLTHSLLQRLIEQQGGDEIHFLMEHLLKFELSRATVANVPFLPLPRERRLKQVAQRLLEEEGAEESLEGLGSVVGASTRTLSRLFRHDTGLTFSQWRHQLLLMKSVSLIEQGHSLEEAARRLGYFNGSSFNAMFRKTLGQAVQRYMKVEWFS